MVAKIIPHGFEDFKEITERYGLWQDNIYVGGDDTEDGN